MPEDTPYTNLDQAEAEYMRSLRDYLRDLPHTRPQSSDPAQPPTPPLLLVTARPISQAEDESSAERLRTGRARLFSMAKGDALFQLVAGRWELLYPLPTPPE